MPDLRLRPLGSTGLEVGEIGIGTWELSGDVWGAKDDAVSVAALRAGLDAGATFVDTAADYGSGHVEELIGGLWSDGVDRARVVLATKVRPQCMVWAPPPERPIAEFFPPERIRSELEGSLRRLRTDYVDVLFLHTWSRSWGHEDEWFGVMSGLREAGLIRSIGISVADDGASDANVAIALGQVDVVQCVYSVFQQAPEYDLFPLAAKHGVGVVARSVFSSGALVQDWGDEPDFPPGDWRATWPQETQRDWFAEQKRMAAEVGAVIEAAGMARHEFCLRYVLGAEAVSVAIPGSANPDHVRANVGAGASGAALPPEVRQRVKQLWLDRKVRGAYNGSG